MLPEALTFAHGLIGTEWYIHQPIPLEVERSADGWYVVRDQVFLAVGHRPTLEEAYQDYLNALGEFCLLVRDAANLCPENQASYRQLLTAIHPVGDDL